MSVKRPTSLRGQCRAAPFLKQARVYGIAVDSIRNDHHAELSRCSPAENLIVGRSDGTSAKDADEGRRDPVVCRERSTIISP
jgi:hypothetical protein